jgi:sugar phosphate isomerase/epimerase
MRRLADDRGVTILSAQGWWGSRTIRARRFYLADFDDGGRDTHEPPGLGTADWDGWIDSLDRVGYEGPIMLECIKRLRERPELLTVEFTERLRKLCGL